MNQNFLQLISQLQTNYDSNIQVVDELIFSQKRTLKKIEFYWNSRYINGQLDELGRIKPFYNISKFRVNVATRATDLDVKDFQIYSENPSDRVRSMILNKEVFNWMKDTNFSKVLNDFGKTRAKYGGALIKKTEKNKELMIEVVPWKNVITDQVDILQGAIIEIHYMSPAEISKKRDVWENIDEALQLATERRGKNKESKGNEKLIPVLEIHGEFPETFDPEIPYGEGDPNKYKPMMFYVAGNFGEKQVMLYYEEEKAFPYKYLAWDSVPGRALGVGVVEDGFEAQMWINEAITAEKNVMDLAGKVFIKTNSTQLGNNILSDAVNGQILEMEDGADASLLNLAPNSLPQFQNLVEKWNVQYERATNTFDTVSGETLPSATTLGAVAIQTAQASSFFDYRREEAGIFWTEVFYKWVLPHITKKINKAHILASDFSAQELSEIDKAFSVYNVNDIVKKNLLNGKVTTQEEYDEMILAITELQRVNGKRRFLDIPEGYFKDFKPKIYLNVTGENKDKKAMQANIFAILGQIQANPNILQDPNLLQLFNQLLDLTGVNFYPIPVANTEVPQEGSKTSVSETIEEPALIEQTNAVLPEAQQS